MATTKDDVIARLNAIYALLDQLVLDTDETDPHFDELAHRRNDTRAAIDDLIQRARDKNAGDLGAVSAELYALSERLCAQSATVSKVKTGVDIAARVIAICAEVAAKLL